MSIDGEERGGTVWRDVLSADALQLVAEGVATFGGFKVTTVMIVRGDDIECVAAAASEEVRKQALGMIAPTRLFEEVMETADRWGLLRFIPHERVVAEAESFMITPDLAVSDDPGAWHPRDELLIPLYDADGSLRAVISVDEPLDGRRPGTEQRQLLETYSLHALRAILTTLEREELAERIEVAAAARRVVRAASSGLSLDALLAQSRAALLEGFGADGLWWRLFPTTGAHGATSDVEPDGDGLGVELPGMDPRVLVVAAALAHHAWDTQQVLVASSALPLPVLDSYPADTAEISEAFLAREGVGSVLIIPLGAVNECLGLAVLHRRDGSVWTSVETEEALDVGHDLGRAVLNARLYERERHLVQRLQALDVYKSQLISTISHELRTPLTSVVGNLELLVDLISEAEPDQTVLKAAAATGRGARRLASLVEDLLLLSRVDDPDVGAARFPVDLRDVVADVVGLHATVAAEHGIEIVVSMPPEPVVVLGDVVQLDRLLVNLLSNAVKYSLAGSTVQVALERQGSDAVLVCADQGFGISPADQESIFGEFFRSGDPSIRAVGGTGLGLAICRRVVDGHGGRIELTSRLGAGSTFRVFLPAAPH